MPIVVLLVEDNRADVMIIEEAVARIGLPIDLQWVRDGDEAIAFLDRAEEKDCPKLLLLDLNLPRRSGKEVLERVRQGKCRMPVLIVSSSNSAADRREAMRLGATEYFCKPASYDGFLKVGSIIAGLLRSHWGLRESASVNEESGEKTIVLIEDNDADAFVIRRALEDQSAAFRIVHFQDGADALPALVDSPAISPDLILMDLNMPRSSGLDILRAIRETPRLAEVPVGIMTGSRSPQDHRDASAIGATRYIEKQLSYDAFVSTIQQAVSEMLRARNA